MISCCTLECVSYYLVFKLCKAGESSVVGSTLHKGVKENSFNYQLFDVWVLQSRTNFNLRFVNDLHSDI